MKRPASSDSLSALMADEGSPEGNRVYSREFQSMLEGLEEEGCMEECGQPPEKKRRLRADQVRALEKNFEVENKLEPERKLKLAQELGLQPRQVAVWFQNRRARWKTKQLERDYGVLKASFDSLKDSFDSLQNQNENLLKEIKGLKSKLNDETTESNPSVKKEQTLASDFTDAGGEPPAAAGPSDSDSSAILNDAACGFAGATHQLLISSTSSPSSAASPPSISYFQLPEAAASDVLGGAQLVKMEEHNFFDEEACNFFSEEQAPTLHWYCPEQWT